MSADIDFSQFRRQGPQSNQPKQVQGEDLDFSQFMRKPKRSVGAKAGRLAGQAVIGAAEAATLPYNLAATATNLGANFGAESIKRKAAEDLKILEQKRAEGALTPMQEKYFNRVKRLAEEGPRQMPQFDVGSLLEKGIEKTTGVDLRPKGVAEHGVRIAGMLKNPGKLATLGKTALDAIKDPKKLLGLAKSFKPGTKELARGFGAGFALEEAKQGDFGPIAVIAATVAGDLIGGAAHQGFKGTLSILRNPKAALASGAAKLARGAELDIRKQIINDFRKAGVQADVGTITGNNIVQSIQAKLAASGLTGKPLEELRAQMTKQITDQYKDIADSIGPMKFSSNHEAGEAVKIAAKRIRESEKGEIAKIYEPSRSGVSNVDVINPTQIARTVQKLESQAKPGTLKSTDQKALIKHLEDVKADLYDAEGQLKPLRVNDAINIKRAIQDIVDFEVQGGAKNSLKLLLGDIDRSLQGYGVTNPKFGKSLSEGNKRFAAHVKKFREGPMSQFLKEGTDPAQIMNKMGSVDGVMKIGRALETSPEGKELFKELKRMKFDQLVGDKMVDSTTHQLKHGTFSKLLEKKQDRALVRELLGQQQLQRLEHLQKASGKLAESAQKFLNASQSATSAVDMAAYTKILFDAMSVLSGNYWPLIRTAGFVGASKVVAKMMADKEFLKLLEDAILARQNPAKLKTIWPKILEKSREFGLQEARPAAHALIESQQEEPDQQAF